MINTFKETPSNGVFGDVVAHDMNYFLKVKTI